MLYEEGRRLCGSKRVYLELFLPSPAHAHSTASGTAVDMGECDQSLYIPLVHFAGSDANRQSAFIDGNIPRVTRGVCHCMSHFPLFAFYTSSTYRRGLAIHIVKCPNV